MSEKISNKRKALVIEYPNSTTHIIPLDKITGLSNAEGECSFLAVGWQETEISLETYNELKKYFQLEIIECRED